MRPTYRQGLLLALCGLLLGFLWLDPFGPHGLAWLRSHHDEMIAWRDAHPLLAALVYLGLTVLAIGCLLPAAAAAMVMAGVVFGFGWGIVLAPLGFSLGALLAFGLSRSVLRQSLRAHLGSRLDVIERRLRRNGGWYLLSLRLAPVVPAFLVNAAMGVSPISARRFFWVSLLGVIPSVLVYVNAGTQLARINRLQDVMTLPVALALTAVALLPWIMMALVRRLRRLRWADSRTR